MQIYTHTNAQTLYNALGQNETTKLHNSIFVLDIVCAYNLQVPLPWNITDRYYYFRIMEDSQLNSKPSSSTCDCLNVCGMQGDERIIQSYILEKFDEKLDIFDQEFLYGRNHVFNTIAVVLKQ